MGKGADPFHCNKMAVKGRSMKTELTVRTEPGELDLSQEGQCLLYGPDATVVAAAKAAVMDLVANVEEGEVYEGTVIEIKDFGAVVELLRNKEGLLHVSELASVVDARGQPEGNHGLVKTQVQLGQKIKVVCIGVDPVQGHIKLSQKRLLRQGRRA